MSLSTPLSGLPNYNNIPLYGADYGADQTSNQPSYPPSMSQFSKPQGSLSATAPNNFRRTITATVSSETMTITISTITITINSAATIKGIPSLSVSDMRSASHRTGSRLGTNNRSSHRTNHQRTQDPTSHDSPSASRSRTHKQSSSYLSKSSRVKPNRRTQHASSYQPTRDRPSHDSSASHYRSHRPLATARPGYLQSTTKFRDDAGKEWRRLRQKVRSLESRVSQDDFETMTDALKNIRQTINSKGSLMDRRPVLSAAAKIAITAGRYTDDESISRNAYRLDNAISGLRGSPQASSTAGFGKYQAGNCLREASTIFQQVSMNGAHRNKLRSLSQSLRERTETMADVEQVSQLIETLQHFQENRYGGRGPGRHHQEEEDAMMSGISQLERARAYLTAAVKKREWKHKYHTASTGTTMRNTTGPRSRYSDRRTRRRGYTHSSRPASSSVVSSAPNVLSPYSRRPPTNTRAGEGRYVTRESKTSSFLHPVGSNAASALISVNSGSDASTL